MTDTQKVTLRRNGFFRTFFAFFALESDAPPLFLLRMVVVGSSQRVWFAYNSSGIRFDLRKIFSKEIVRKNWGIGSYAANLLDARAT